jgi:hypothetical protein
MADRTQGRGQWHAESNGNMGSRTQPAQLNGSIVKVGTTVLPFCHGRRRVAEGFHDRNAI